MHIHFSRHHFSPPCCRFAPGGKSAHVWRRRGSCWTLATAFALLVASTFAQAPSATTSTTRYTYDADGNRTSITYPSGNVVTYTYDYADRPSSGSSGGTTLVGSTVYLPFGPPTQIAYGNGTTETMVFNNRYQLEQKKLTGPAGVIAQYDYQEDAAGNITQIHDATDPTYNRDFAYDDLNRLLAANGGTSLWGMGTYTYDLMGNMRSNSVTPAKAFSYDGTTSKLLAVSTGGVSRSLSYDAAGNETGYIANRTYSPRNQLLSVADSSPPGHTITYGYDGRGVRITRSESPAGGNATARALFCYSPELNLLGVTRDDGPSYDIAWFGGRPVAQKTGSGLRYTFTDHIGTPILQTDASGAVVWRAEYDPYGDVRQMRVGAPTDQPLRFPGQEVAMTSEGGEENYNIFRWYRAGWGRYTQSDLIGLKGGLNLYRYGSANPLNKIDALGLAVNVICRRVDVGQGLGAAVFGAYFLPVHCRLQVSCPCSDGDGSPRAPFNRTVGLEAVNGDYQLNTDQFLAPHFGGPSQDYDRGWFSVPVRPPGGSSGCNFERCILNEASARQSTTPQSFPRYAIAGPNSNSYVRNLVGTCGGSADWPDNAYGANPNPFWGGNYQP
jgi:RHS repeat-associated protein